MTYRNINVNGTSYKFVIGKKFTKVVGIGSIAHEFLGKKIGNSDRYLTEPSDVRRFILGAGEVDLHFHDGPHECINANKPNRYVECEGKVTFGTNPFEAEIHQKYYYAYRCEACYDALADDI